MRNKKEEIDWQVFWFREVLLLGTPWLIAVSLQRQDTYISPARIAVLLLIQLGLTILNVLWSVFRAPSSDRTRSVSRQKN